MPKSVPISVIDTLLDKIATATVQAACYDEPKSRDDAITAFTRAQVALTNSDFTKETIAGKRNLLIAAKTDVVVDNSGLVSHIALCDAASLLAVSTVNNETLSTGDQYDFPEWVINVSVA